MGVDQANEFVIRQTNLPPSAGLPKQKTCLEHSLFTQVTTYETNGGFRGIPKDRRVGRRVEILLALLCSVLSGMSMLYVWGG
jgi:hypothetical protein